MWDLKACRGCLTSKGKLERIGEVSKRLYSSITGVEIKDGDGFPTYLCIECHTFFRKAFAFRRKCRRAHFVLKEIIIVRNQATLNDILTVNRKSTNLQSGLGKWKLSNSGFYNIDNTESDTEVLEKEQIMIQYKPCIQNLSIYHIVDIEPAALSEPVPLEEDATIAEDDRIDAQESNEPSMDIDLEDVFKDLKEDDSETSDFEIVEKPKEIFPGPVKIKQNKTSDVDIEKKNKNEIKLKVRALSHVNIKKLTDEEQNAVLAKRLSLEPFKSAIYKCSICICIFDNIDLLMMHVRTHNINSVHLCSVCKNTFESELELATHMAENHLYIYQCRTCNKEMYTLPQVVQHCIEKNYKSPKLKCKSQLMDTFDIILVPPEEMCIHDNGTVTDLRCSLCKMHFSKRKTHEQHLQSHIEPPAHHDMVQCDICKTWHKNNMQLEAHLIAWHMYNYQCKLCNGICYNEDEAHRHQRKCIKQCRFCKRKFKSNASVYSHRYECHRGCSRLHHCIVCGYSSATEPFMYQHQLTEHGFIHLKHHALVDLESACGRCNVQFLSKRAYQVHALRHSHPEARKIPNGCFYCKKLFDSDDDYLFHLGFCRYAKKFPKQCQFCEEVLASRMEYDHHLATDHPSMEDGSLPKARQCELCGLMVRTKFSVHMAKHGCERSVRCAQCEPATRHSDANCYAAHVLSAHSHRPYTCALCHLAFQQRTDCRDHILKVHSPVFPYKCMICEQHFAHSHYLISHLKKEHKIITDKDRKWNLPPIRYKVVTYPHMRVNLSMLDKTMLSMIQIELADYLHENIQILNDYSDYVIMKPPKEDDFKEELVKAKKRVKKVNSVPVPKKIKREAGSISLAENHIKDEMLENTQIDSEIVITEDNKSLPVIDHEGCKYIVINNITYKIENDNR